MDDVLLTSRDGGILTLTLNRPERRNALSNELQGALLKAFKDAEVDPTVRAIILTGGGDKMFCSGGDLSQMGAGDGFLANHEGRFNFVDLLLTMERLKKPIVCRVSGHVMAGGVGLMLACDLVIAADDVTFSTPEIERGFFPMMISALITRNLGKKRAYELMMLGERWTAAQAERTGLINHAVPRSELDAKVKNVASRLASMSLAALGMGKKALARTSDMAVDDALAYLHSQLAVSLMTEDAMEGVGAFMEKRAPVWKDR